MLSAEDVRVAISCCAALNLLTNLMTSDKVWGSFSLILAPKAFNEDEDGSSVTVETAPPDFYFE